MDALLDTIWTQVISVSHAIPLVRPAQDLQQQHHAPHVRQVWAHLVHVLASHIHISILEHSLVQHVMPIVKIVMVLKWISAPAVTQDTPLIPVITYV